MPTYTYKCPECGGVADVKMSVDDEVEVACKRCTQMLSKKIRMIRVPTVPAIVFKGDGFYVTDSRKSDN